MTDSEKFEMLRQQAAAAQKDLKEYIDAFRHLHTARVKGHRAPHKAVLLLAIIDLVERGVIRNAQIELSDTLESQFNAVWKRYLGESAIFTRDIAKPFFHMQHEAFWKLVDRYEAEARLVAEYHPWHKDKNDKKELPVGSYSVKAMRNAFAYAEMDARLFQTLQNADARAMLRVILISEYLSDQPTRTMPNLAQLMMLALPIIALVA